MSHELNEPRQAGDPTRLESNDAALADKSTGISSEGLNLARPERLDASRCTDREGWLRGCDLSL